MHEWHPPLPCSISMVNKHRNFAPGIVSIVDGSIAQSRLNESMIYNALYRLAYWYVAKSKLVVCRWRARQDKTESIGIRTERFVC